MVLLQPPLIMLTTILLILISQPNFPENFRDETIAIPKKVLKDSCMAQALPVLERLGQEAVQLLNEHDTKSKTCADASRNDPALVAKLRELKQTMSLETFSLIAQHVMFRSYWLEQDCSKDERYRAMDAVQLWQEATISALTRAQICDSKSHTNELESVARIVSLGRGVRIIKEADVPTKAPAVTKSLPPGFVAIETILEMLQK